ncbi:MAG TPA: lysylphosphatidylglycerol synthase transmembrane domain-containing protein [Gaiellaceae bacterium]|nr:lysylphosphatidylglycerol synthase transmembrane domain-containing protein [Gaiellaceae bacterium]
MATVEDARPRRLGLLQAGSSLVALVAIAWWASKQHPPHLALDEHALARLGAALALYAGGTALRAERWQRILERRGLARGRAASYGLTLVGYMGNNTLPARAGDVMRVMMLGGKRRAVLGTVVAERALDVAALGLIFGVVVAERGLAFGPLPYLAAAGAAAAVAGVLVWRLAPRVREWALPVATATRELLSAYGAALLALSLVIWSIEAAVYATVGSAVGIRLGVTGGLYVMALTNLSALVPAAPGYVGTFDAAVLLALRSLGLPALGYLLVLRFVLFVPITVAGFAVLVARHARRNR